VSILHGDHCCRRSFYRRARSVGREIVSEKEQCKRNQSELEGAVKMSTSTMENPKIVSPDEWFAARKKLLAKEKRLTRERDAIAAERSTERYRSEDGVGAPRRQVLATTTSKDRRVMK
jgi:Bacterial protein of unknown function (DUF899)